MKQLLIIFLVLFFAKSFATSNHSYFKTKNGISLSYQTNGSSVRFEDDEKMHILHDLVISSYSKTADYQEYNILLRFINYQVSSDLYADYFIGYSDYINPNTDASDTGIVITITSFQNSSISEILRMIYYGTTNTSFIKNNQQKYNFFEEHYFAQFQDSIKIISVEPNVVAKALNEGKGIIPEQKIFRNDSLSAWSPEGLFVFDDVSYYYENNKYHVFKKNRIFHTDTNRNNKNYKNVISLPDIKELYKASLGNYFLFVNDSSFYYYNGDSISDIFQLNNVCHRTPMSEFKTFWNPHVIVLTFNTGDSLQSFAYFPESGSLIEDYVERLEQFNSDLLVEKERENNWYLILSIALNVLLFVIIIVRRRK